MTDTEINRILNSLTALHQQDPRLKGAPGERAAILALKRYKNLRPNSVILHSVAYPYIPGTPGNIHWENNTMIHYDRTTGVNDEIDIVYVTSYRIFLIEVKTYRRTAIKLTDLWEFNKNTPVPKSVQSQTEKHCRHFYYTFYDHIPDGKMDYIVPIIVFVDKCRVDDKRSDSQREEMPACTLNTLNKIVSVYDTPLDNAIDVDALVKQIRRKAASIEEVIL